MFYAILVSSIGVFFVVLALVDLLRPKKVLGNKKASSGKDRSFVRWFIYGGVLMGIGGYGAWTVSNNPGVTDESQLDWMADVQENCDAYRSPDAGVTKSDTAKKNQDLLKAVQLNDMGGIFDGMADSKTAGGFEVRINIGKVKFTGRPVGSESEIHSMASRFKKGDCVRIFGNNVAPRASSEEGRVCDFDYVFSIVSLIKCNGR
jgi:hypothetical protein